MKCIFYKKIKISFSHLLKLFVLTTIFFLTTNTTHAGCDDANYPFWWEFTFAVYKDKDFKNGPWYYNCNSAGMHNLDTIGMNDNIESIKIYDNPPNWINVCNLYNGYLCQHKDWGGSCWPTPCGEHNDFEKKGMMNIISSIGLIKRGEEETPEACNYFYSGIWLGVGNNCNCCKEGETCFYSNNQKVCTDNKKIYTCNSADTPVGAMRGERICYNDGKFYTEPATCTVGSIGTEGKSTKFGCCTSGVFESITYNNGCYYPNAATADNFAKSCAYAVKGSATGDYSDVFIGQEGTTNVNRCCGNDAIINGDFESSFDGTWDSNIKQEPCPPGRAGKCGKITSSSDELTSHSLSRITINNPDDTEYKISGWVYSYGPDADIFLFAIADPSYGWYQGSRSGNDSTFSTNGVWGAVKITTKEKNKWVYLEKTIKVPNFMKEISLRLDSNSNGAVYFDDVKITGPGMDYGYISPDGKYVCNYAGNKWKWEFAEQAEMIFQIKPIGKIFLNNILYNLISNGGKWFVCNPGGILETVPQNSFDITELDDYTRFFGPSEENLMTYAGEGGSTSSGSLCEEGVSEEGDEISADQFMTDVGFSTACGETSIASNDNSLTFIISPKEVVQEGVVKIKINGLTTGQHIRNDSIYKIKVTNGNTLVPTKHRNFTIAQVSSGEPGSTPFEVKLPKDLELGFHSLNITILGPQPKTYLLKDAFNIVENILNLPSGDPIELNPARFLCHKEGGKGNFGVVGTITECCGPSYTYCRNENKDYVRISGGPTSLIKDYYSDSGRNTVFRKPIPKITGYYSGGTKDSVPNSYITGYVEHQYTVKDFPITDWSRYDYLEFDVFFVGNSTVGSTNLNILISNSSVDNIVPFDKNKLFNDSVIKYSTTYSRAGDNKNRWHHIKIPLSEINNKGNVQRIRFYINQTELENEVGVSRVEFKGVRYLMMFGLDRFYLSSPEIKYCATDFSPYLRGGVEVASKVGKWITDLDEDRDACNNVAPYGWTGTQCCGDDNGVPNSDYFNGVESYNDIEAGCWGGRFVANNTIIHTIQSQSS